MKIKDRSKTLEEAYNRREFFMLSSLPYFQFFKAYLEASLEADLHSNGDITTALLNEHLPAKVEGKIVAKQDGVLSGIPEMKYIAKHGGVSLSIGKKMGGEKDGEKFESGMSFEKGDMLFTVKGSPLKVLQLERTFLNILQRMCGIATAAAKFETAHAKVAVTRKTPLPFLDKRAAIDGSVLPHRVNLSDAIMIKDTHFDQFGRDFEALADSLRNRSYQGISFIEIEVLDKKEALLAAEMAKNLDLNVPIVVMLDNFVSKDAKKAVKSLQKAGLYDYVLVEVSGGISSQNYKDYDIEGVDVMSVGEITHSAGVVDISMKVK
ncbi:hypothetical protein HOG48_02300 [Candidatus Peregrinibacteria bacterium]|jgi:nicotinate-nucleotide pyrophosphorylase (carboxylating)|nr:hypothetical protein [Candidatus Peregrinibacteria bacterium]